MGMVTFVGVAAALALLFLAGLAFAAPGSETAGSSTTNLEPERASAPDASVRALRRISVPFGITDTQQLLSGGSQVRIQGHAECWDASRMFEVRVRLAQSTTNAFGEAHAIAICDQAVAQQTWTVIAPAEGAASSQAKFAKGAAIACAQATEFGQQGVVDEHAWCKDVTLSTSGY